MFDLGISKIAILAVIGLIVIGPERLPHVARMLGTLLGRAQRYIADVKAEVGREIQLDELRKMQSTVRDAAQSVERTVYEHMQDTEAGLASTFGHDAGNTIGNFGGHDPHDAMGRLLPSGPSARRLRDWRRKCMARQSAQPLWFRQSQRKRTRVLSGAARVARYRSKMPR